MSETEKYIIEIEEGKGGVMFCQSGIVSIGLHLKDEESLRGLGIRSAIPYTEPDLEQVRKEAYNDGYETAKHECEDCRKVRADAEKELTYKAYRKGLSDAWEAARKILQMHDLTVFGLEHDGVFESPLNEGQQMTPQEAIEKLKAYEQEQEAIQVGDEVLYGNAKGIVIRPEDSNRYASVFTAIGEHICAENKDLTKTGRHFPEIAAVLQKMKEES